MNIAKYTEPLEKGIRTTEGILTAIITALITIASGIDPNALPRKEAAIVIAGTSVLYTIQRGLIKVVALQKGIGVAAPVDNAKVDSILSTVSEQADHVSTIVEQNQGLVDELGKLKDLDLSKLPTKEELDDFYGQLKEFLGNLNHATDRIADSTKVVSRTTSQPVEDVSIAESDPDPAMTAAVAVSPEEEAAVQPPAEVIKPDSSLKPDPPAQTQMSVDPDAATAVQAPSVQEITS